MIPMATPGWFHKTIAPLLDAADVRGEDRVIPHGDVIDLPRRPTVSVRTLPMFFFGDKDIAGDDYANVRVGLRSNLEYLRSEFRTPDPPESGLRQAELHLAGGTVRYALVRVRLPFSLGAFGPTGCRGSLELEVWPPGEFL
jgi:hypothetical protein